MLSLDICAGFVLVVLGILFAFFAVSIYNGLVSLRNNIDKAWSNIDVLLKQRYDLIPNLVEVVKGYAKYERSVFKEITELRASLITGGPHDRAVANERISSSLKSIFAVAENYPNLKASENFLELQKQLASIENQIADRREFYNDSVLLYNTRIQSFPDGIFAALFGMRLKEYFKAEEEEKKPVKTGL
ncbi:MAG: LemA family protein [Candidatus Bilamarchaeaceae archaeon]